MPVVAFISLVLSTVHHYLVIWYYDRAVFRDEGRTHLLAEGINMYQLQIDGPDEFTQKIEDTSVSYI